MYEVLPEVKSSNSISLVPPNSIGRVTVRVAMFSFVLKLMVGMCAWVAGDAFLQCDCFEHCELKRDHYLCW